jgi:hypothetical protein
MIVRELIKESEINEALGLLSAPEEDRMLNRLRQPIKKFYDHLGGKIRILAIFNECDLCGAIFLIEPSTKEKASAPVVVHDLYVKPSHRGGPSYSKLVAFFCHWLLNSSNSCAVALEARPGLLNSLVRFTKRYGVTTIPIAQTESLFLPLSSWQDHPIHGQHRKLASLSEDLWQGYIELFRRQQEGNAWMPPLSSLKERILTLDPQAHFLWHESPVEKAAVLANAIAIQSFHSALGFTGSPTEKHLVTVRHFALPLGKAGDLLPLAVSLAKKEGAQMLHGRDISCPGPAFRYQQRLLLMVPSHLEAKSFFSQYRPDCLFC